MMLGKQDKITCKNIFEESLTLYTKINSKYVKDLNIRLDAVKLFEGNISRIHFDINCKFLD